MKRPLLVVTGLLVLSACSPDVVINTPPAGLSSSSSVSAASVSSSSEGIPALSHRSSAASAAASSKSPNSLLIKVPFTSQAPFANWDKVHEDTCEEASVLMDQLFLTGVPSISQQDAENELQKMVQWETDNGYGPSVTAEQLLTIAKNVYGLDGRVDSDVSEAHIKDLLQQGYPVIVPAAGRMLGNPYFSGAGPWYHMLLVVGYAGDTAVTNDPGTRRGEGYRYSFSTLINATHDWTGKNEDIENGPKRVLILWKK